jgi:hypothetical protein
LVLNPDGQAYLEATNNWRVAPSLKLRIESFKVRKTDEIDKAFATMAKSRVDALLLESDPVFNINRLAQTDHWRNS